jgi:DNA-binding CsgD family transcriptional regulator
MIREMDTAPIEPVPAGEAESCGEGLILLGGSDRIRYATGRATELLHTLFGPSDPEVLPEELRLQIMAPDDDGSWVQSFVIKRGACHLVVRRIPVDDGVALFLSDISDPGVGPRPGRSGLTGRQAEVLAHIAQGHPTKYVASTLGITPRTVEKHIERSLRALGVSNRWAAANLLRREGWIPPRIEMDTSCA